MAIELITWAAKTVTPLYDAIIQDTCAGRSGILHGCSLSASGNTITVGAGYGIIKGRLFKVTSTTVNVTLASTGTLYGVLYIRLNLSNTSTPISIIANTGSTAYEVSQNEDANFTDGVYEMELATFNVSTTSITNLSQSRPVIPYSRTPIYTTKEQLGYTTAQNAYVYRNRMPENSIAILGNEDLSTLPYSGATGICLIRKSTETAFTMQFFVYSTGTNQGDILEQYTMKNGGWEKVPSTGDCFYLYGQSYRFYFQTGGYISNGGKDVYFQIPINKSLDQANAIVDGGGMYITVRQRGNYLAGTGSDYENPDSVGYTIRNNCILAKATKTSGFGGVNNEACGITGYCDVIIN